MKNNSIIKHFKYYCLLFVLCFLFSSTILQNKTYADSSFDNDVIQLQSIINELNDISDQKINEFKRKADNGDAEAQYTIGVLQKLKYGNNPENYIEAVK